MASPVMTSTPRPEHEGPDALVGEVQLLLAVLGRDDGFPGGGDVAPEPGRVAEAERGCADEEWRRSARRC